MTDGGVLRLGSWAAILGAVVALVANGLHPRVSETGDYVAAEMELVSGSDAWVPIHVAIMLAFLLIVFGLFALTRSMKGGRAQGLSRVALGALVLSAPVALVHSVLDAYALKAVADAVAESGPELGGAGTVIANITWSTLMGLNVLFLGVTPIAFGLAVASDGGYPRWLGWVALALGVVSVVNGLGGLIAGPTTAFFMVFPVAAGLITLWVLAMGVLLGRRAAGAPAVAPAPA